MSKLSCKYRRLCRLREKRRRLDAVIARLAAQLAGKRSRWGGCSASRNR